MSGKAWEWRWLPHSTSGRISDGFPQVLRSNLTLFALGDSLTAGGFGLSWGIREETSTGNDHSMQIPVQLTKKSM